ncbi:MAG: ATP-binding protein, partial [Myxococcota bacterium]
RGGPGGRKRRRRGHPGVLVFELIPTEATALRARATGLVWIAAVAAGLILLLSLAIQKADRHRRMLEIKLAEERHLAALGEMSAVLAHELKNPLTSLKGHTQLAIEAVQPDGASLKRKMNRVLNEALRIEEITNNLLDFIRSGNLHRQPSSVRTLIERSMRTMQNADTEIHLGEDIQWSFDLDRMQQVLINLLSNAEEAVDTAAKVDVSAKIIHQTLQIVVRDHGPGFAPGTEETSFEPFRTDRTRGTGLGLAICRRIVEAHGGQIVACNHPDGGAQLTLTIPKESTS